MQGSDMPPPSNREMGMLTVLAAENTSGVKAVGVRIHAPYREPGTVWRAGATGWEDR